MSDIFRAWEAGFVRRWHTNTTMVEFDDRNHSHQHRVTILLLLFFPDSTRDAIIDAITHDQGEIAFADVPYPVKREHTAVRTIGNHVEEMEIIAQGFDFHVTKEEVARRSWCDLLDSYIWMLRCAPNLQYEKAWKDQLVLLIKQAEGFGVQSKLYDFMEAAQNKYV